MWAFLCGWVSAGPGTAPTAWALLAGIALTGPLVCGASQIVNDWFDKDVDALNEPHRPIPSGRVPGNTALHFAVIWTVIAQTWALMLGTWVAAATCLGLLLAWAYSAPPLRLKLNGWWGNSAVALSYEGLAWITGAAIVLGGKLPPSPILMIALLYSIGAHGIMTLNDFKSVHGDLRMGIRSLPAQLGREKAAKVACVFMLIPQLCVVALLLHWQLVLCAVAVSSSVLAQLLAMRRLLSDPRAPRSLVQRYRRLPLCSRDDGYCGGTGGLVHMTISSSRPTDLLSWWQIIRLGLIQTALGGIVVLTTSTLNRIMVVEMALAASLPGFLVTIHHVVQLARPRIGHGSDIGGRRTPWIIGGMIILGAGGIIAAWGTTLIATQYWLGLCVAALGFFAIGVGTGATGTSLLALLAKQVSSERKPAAAALVWFMMIVGFAVTAGVAGPLS
jgi:chlorophyll synthase